MGQAPIRKPLFARDDHIIVLETDAIRALDLEITLKGALGEPIEVSTFQSIAQAITAATLKPPRLLFIDLPMAPPGSIAAKRLQQFGPLAWIVDQASNEAGAQWIERPIGVAALLALFRRMELNPQT